MAHLLFFIVLETGEKNLQNLNPGINENIFMGIFTQFDCFVAIFR